MPDENGYPTQEELARIKAWDALDLDGMMEFVQSIWWMPDPGAEKLPTGQWELNTWGWSGNEDIIEAMRENYMWWFMYWEQSRRGGHYLFSSMSNVLGRHITTPNPRDAESAAQDAERFFKALDEMTPETLGPNELRRLADLLERPTKYGATTARDGMRACASAWEADRARIEALEKWGERADQALAYAAIVACPGIDEDTARLVDRTCVDLDVEWAALKEKS